MARVLLTDDARNDLRDFDRDTQVILLKALKKLETEPEKRGAPLGSRSTSNLTGLRKLVVGDRDYRIVYRVEADGSVCVIWVIGHRADAEVYVLAKARLQSNTDSTFRQGLGGLLDGVFSQIRGPDLPTVFNGDPP